MDVSVGRDGLVESGKRSPHLLDVKVKHAEDKRITLIGSTGLQETCLESKKRASNRKMFSSCFAVFSENSSAGPVSAQRPDMPLQL